MRKTISPEIRAKWLEVVKAKNMPQEFYADVKIRYLEGPRGEKGYTLGVIFNPGRAKRPRSGEQDITCHMCRIVNEIKENPSIAILPNDSIPGYYVAANEFPPTEGAVVLISNEESPMYRTNELSSLGEKGESLRALFDFGQKYGFRIFHQTLGAGATIDRHEHWHGTTLHDLQTKIKKRFGFDAAELEPVRGISGVSTMPTFPFAHLVFDIRETERIAFFIKNMGETLPSSLKDGSVPHTLSQGEQGVLIAPTKIDVGRSMGSERAPGYFFVPTREDFESTTYDSTMQFMRERFFPKEIGLEKLV